MTDRPDPDEEREVRARRRRRAEIFGDVLPESTGDDRDEPGEERGADDWLRRNVPPHHG